MPRRLRVATGGLIFHVLNRRVGGLTLFESPADYVAFEEILQEAYDRTRMRLAVYCLMPTHWHLMVCPREDGELSEVLRWITVTHTQRWHSRRQSAGSGPVYQGRFKSFPVQRDEHFLMVARYVERNPQRAQLVEKASEWPWSSLWRRQHGDTRSQRLLCEWPVAQPSDWLTRVHRAESSAELDVLRKCAQGGRPFGSDLWVKRTAKRLGLESTLRPRGRPKGS